MTRRRRDRGSASLEFLGVLPILLLVALAGIQLGLVAYTASQAGTAARAAARMAALHDAPTTGEAAGENAVSDWLNVTIVFDPTDDSVTATATVDIPSVLPGLDPGSISRSATMPKEDTEEDTTP
ncbi:TadE/TadG family type IV pilus assembly protein [Streptomyces sp. NBC_01262]|uniref:TadE/TadG family type IV pilus assembly protein n=1 Tax=Streptomyces sp. NBC_01262 TaxID=2903803 RepID=UPI002E2EC29F|nr:TadE family protein [Streptomyces sp. NBC_01262]